MQKTPILALAILAAGSAASFAAEPASDSIVRLLNSRNAGSPRLYAAAASAVADDAAKGKPIQQFIVALFAKDKDAPRSLRVSDEVREAYLANSRHRIRESADKGNSMAIYLLALETHDAAGLRRAASMGNVQAMNTLGMMRFTEAVDGEPGADAEAALSEAHDLFKAAAEKNDPNGLNNYGMCLQRGYGCEKDEARAFECFKKAADERHPEAINNMGRFYREGVVVEKNLGEATRLFSVAAGMGCEWGQLNYATALMFGEGIVKNEKRAVELMEGVAAKGNADAMDFLAHCREKGLGGLERDSWKALVWSLRAKAARGDANAAKWLEANGEAKSK